MLFYLSVTKLETALAEMFNIELKFVIFQQRVEHQKDGLSTYARQNIYFQKMFLRQEICTRWEFQILTFFEKVKKVLDKTDEFCESIEKENLENINMGNDNTETDRIVEKIKNFKT